MFRKKLNNKIVELLEELNKKMDRQYVATFATKKEKEEVARLINEDDKKNQIRNLRKYWKGQREQFEEERDLVANGEYEKIPGRVDNREPLWNTLLWTFEQAHVIKRNSIRHFRKELLRFNLMTKEQQEDYLEGTLSSIDAMKEGNFLEEQEKKEREENKEENEKSFDLRYKAYQEKLERWEKEDEKRRAKMDPELLKRWEDEIEKIG